MLPYVNNTATRCFKLKELSGGTNYALDSENIHDTQLKDSKNVWFKNGVLKTRPGIVFGENSAFIAENNGEFSQKVILDKKNTANIRGETYVLEIVITEPMAWTRADINIRYVSKENSIPLGEASLEAKSVTVLPVQYKGDIFLYLHGYGENNNSISRIYTVKKLSEGVYGALSQVREDEIYTPLVLTNCWPCYGDSGKINSVISKGATQVEGFNLLGNRYRMQFSTFDNSPSGHRVFYDASFSDDCFSYMEYSLPYTKSGLSGEITVQYTDITGLEHIHRVDCPALNAPTVEEESMDGAYLHAEIKGGVCHICFKESKESNASVVTVSNAEYVNNNMTVTAPCENSSENLKKVCGMTQAVWYGNNSLGIGGGSRLFFCGGSDSLVIWSDFENPLYFPENNYAYVGDKTQRTTAFGKQGSSLIIFKENEIYSTQYTQGDVTAEELNDQRVIDITASLAYFPMTLIHPHIGCDCPETVQLLRNRLTFASSEGKVYVITDQNQFSERNVYEVSELIYPRLKNEDMKRAVSADWDGRYVLFSGNRAYVMDYNSYGYVNIASYTRDDAGNRLIPWFVWELEEVVAAAAVTKEGLLGWIQKTGEEHILIQPFFMDGREERDQVLTLEKDGRVIKESKSIPSVIKTKHFDLGEGHRVKVLERVLLGLEGNGLAKVTFATDGSIPDMHLSDGSSLVPVNRYTKSLGIEISAEDRIALSDIRVIYRMGKNM